MSENMAPTLVDVQYILKWISINLHPFSLWPDKIPKKKNLIYYLKRSLGLLLTIWITIFLTVPEIFATLNCDFILDEIINIATLITSDVAATLRILVFWYKKKALAWCLECLTENWTQLLSPDERELTMKSVALSRRITIGFTILCQCLFWSSVFLKMLQFIYVRLDADLTPTDLARLLLFPGFFPFDLRQPLNFALAFSGQFIAAYWAVVIYSSFDCFITILIINICCQANLLRRSMEVVIEDEAATSTKMFRENFNKVVKRHHVLVEFAKVVGDTINPILLGIIFMELFQFWLQLSGLLTVINHREPGKFPILQVIFIICYLNITVIHFFLYCYIGEMLVEQSEGLGFSTYSCKWYNLSGRKAKDVIFVMQRARIPLHISVGQFGPVSMELFGKVMKTSMSYFSVFLTMKEQSEA